MSQHSIVMSAFRRRSIENNLFPAALPAVEPWERFRWHGATGNSCDTFKEHSSQALTIDVFGTLQVHPQRDEVLDYWARQLGLPAGGAWEISLEWHDVVNHLREKQPTRVDAVARSPRSLIFFECKFSELDGGNCSQRRPIASGRRKGLVQCNGNYVRQTNPANGREARCALTAKGIRYWDWIPELFDYDADCSYVPCPFAGPWFQWMRNLATCRAVAQAAGLQPAFVVVFADGPGLPMAMRIRDPEWQRFIGHLDPQAAIVRTMAFQDVLKLACQALPRDPILRELAAWVDRKINSVCGLGANWSSHPAI